MQLDFSKLETIKADDLAMDLIEQTAADKKAGYLVRYFGQAGELITTQGDKLWRIGPDELSQLTSHVKLQDPIKEVGEILDDAKVSETVRAALQVSVGLENLNYFLYQKWSQ